MKHLLRKKILCIGLSVLCGLQCTTACSAAEAEELVEMLETVGVSEYLLNDLSEWKTGQYSGTSGAYESWSGRLCYANSIAVNPGMVYRISESDNTYSIVVLQLDSAFNVISQDTYKNGGEISMSADTAFIRLYIYNSANYGMSYSQYEELFSNGYSVKISLIENYSNLINETELTNPGLWESGAYSEKYQEENTQSAIRMKDFKEVEAGAAYSLSLSNPTYSAVVVQLDEQMNILGSRTMKNGSEYIMHDNARYVRVSLKDTASYVMNLGIFEQQCDAGLEFSINKVKNYSSEISDTNIANIGLWETGMISAATGINADGGYAIRMIDNKTCMSATDYTVVCSNDTFRLSIAEYNSDGSFIKINNVKNGDSFTTSEDAVSVAVYICIPNVYSMSYSKYSECFGTEDFALAINAVSEEEPEVSTEDIIIDEIPEVSTEDVIIDEVPEVSTEDIIIDEVPEVPNEDVLDENVGSMPPNNSNELYYMAVEENIVQLSINDSSYRVVLEEYSADYEYITQTDLGNWDYLYINENTAYAAVSAYQYVDGTKVEGTYQKLTQDMINTLGLQFISKNDLNDANADAALFGPELNMSSLSNKANYRSGWYKSWGGEYEYKTSGICSRNYYEVTQDSYFINVNDSRVGVSLREYDANGKWIKCVDTMYNGAVYIPSENAAYVSIILNSTEWATGVNKLLGYGLVIDLSDEYDLFATEKCDIDSFDLRDADNWRTGEYVYGTGDYGVDANCFCTTKILKVDADDSPRMVNLWDSNIKMVLLEMREDGSVIQSTTLYDGQKWNRLDETAYIGISLVGSDEYSYDYFIENYNAGRVCTFDKFEKYNYNTVMNPITADEFMEIMNVGWNLGNSLDSHYGDRDEANPALGQERIWGNITITRELIDYIADLGFNTIRIPVTWYYNTYTDENGKLRVHEEWFDRVQDVVDYAIANDMYVFLNTHHEQPIIFTGTDDPTFAQVLSNAEDLWTEIATFFRDYDEHLIFEAYNEVDNIAQSWSYSAESAAQMNQLNQVFVDVVRATGGNNTQRILCVPTLLDGYNDLILNDYVKPYDPSGEGLLLTQIHSYSYQFDQDIESLFVNLEKFAKENNLPVIIGEFGTKPSYSPIEYREEASSNFVARANAHGLRCIYWDDGNLGNYGLVDRKDFSNSEHEILAGLINPVAYKTDNKVSYDEMDDFVYMTLNQSTGEVVEDKYWGSIVTADTDGHGIVIPKGSDYLTLNLATIGDATLQKIHYVHFYDENMQFISAMNKGNGYNNITLDIPEGAAYLRVGINNSYSATKPLQYLKFFTYGEMKLTIGYVDKDSAGSVVPDAMDGTTENGLLEDKDTTDFIGLLSEVDFSDFTEYESGSYYYATGVKTDSTDCIRLVNYKEVANGGNDTYVYTTSKSGIRLTVVEIDESFKYIKKTELVNNKAITLNGNTRYLAITISNPYMNYEVNYTTYEDFFNDGIVIGFEKQ